MSKASPISKDVHEAFRRTVYAWAPGVEDLALRMGKTPGVLYNKANLNEPQHHQPTLQDAVVIQVVTGDKQITGAMARLMGGVFIDLTGITGEGDAALLDLVTAWMREQGELFASFHEAYGDGVIDAADFRKIRKEAFDVLQAVLSFLQRVQGLQR